MKLKQLCYETYLNYSLGAAGGGIVLRNPRKIDNHVFRGLYHPPRYVDQPEPVPSDAHRPGRTDDRSLSGDSSTKLSREKNTNDRGGYGNPRSLTQYEIIPYDQLLDMAVNEAKKRGANGISNYIVTTKTLEYGTITKYTISGVLIRIE